MQLLANRHICVVSLSFCFWIFSQDNIIADGQRPNGGYPPALPQGIWNSSNGQGAVGVSPVEAISHANSAPVGAVCSEDELLLLPGCGAESEWEDWLLPDDDLLLEGVRQLLPTFTLLCMLHWQHSTMIAHIAMVSILS
jgi:hypothetical protein